MTATTFRAPAGAYWTYTLDSQPRVKGVTTMMKGLSGPPESYFTGYTADHAIDNWERLSQMGPAARRKELADATKARFASAAVRGTAVHKLAEPLSHGEEVVVPDHLRGHVEACIAFLDGYSVKPLATEPALFSRKNKHAGSADLFADVTLPVSGKTLRILADYKTNESGPWGSVAFQFAGYRYSDLMLSGNGGKDSAELPVPEVDECWAIWLRGDGFDVYPMHVTPEVYRQLLYIDQCRIADADCKDYKADALPHAETLRKVRLADIEGQPTMTVTPMSEV